MFELNQQNAKIAHVNLREEKHGEDDVLACDLKVEAKMSNTFLSQLHPTLRESLYERGPQLALDIADNPLPKLRFPLLVTPLKWEGKIQGGKVTLHAPVSDDDLVVFADVDELRLSPQDGGTIIVVFRAKFRPDGDQASRLPFLLGKLVEISVQKPTAEESKSPGNGGDMLGDGDDDSDGDPEGDQSDRK